MPQIILNSVFSTDFWPFGFGNRQLFFLEVFCNLSSLIYWSSDRVGLYCVFRKKFGLSDNSALFGHFFSCFFWFLNVIREYFTASLGLLLSLKQACRLIVITEKDVLNSRKRCFTYAKSKLTWFFEKKMLRLGFAKAKTNLIFSQEKSRSTQVLT